MVDNQKAAVIKHGQNGHIEFNAGFLQLANVAWDSYIDVRGNRYSVPSFWCGRAVNIRIGLDNTLRIYGDEQLLATYLLQEVTQGWQKVPEHHQALWQQVSRVASRSLSVYEELL